MNAARRKAVASIRDHLAAAQTTLDAFARGEDYMVACHLDEAAAYIGAAVDSIEKAEAVQ